MSTSFLNHGTGFVFEQELGRYIGCALCPEEDSEPQLHSVGLILRKSYTVEQLQKIEVRFMRNSIDLNHQLKIGRGRILEKRWS